NSELWLSNPDTGRNVVFQSSLQNISSFLPILVVEQAVVRVIGTLAVSDVLGTVRPEVGQNFKPFFDQDPGYLEFLVFLLNPEARIPDEDSLTVVGCAECDVQATPPIQFPIIRHLRPVASLRNRLEDTLSGSKDPKIDHMAAADFHIRGRGVRCPRSKRVQWCHNKKLLANLHRNHETWRCVAGNGRWDVLGDVVRPGFRKNDNSSGRNVDTVDVDNRGKTGTGFESARRVDIHLNVCEFLVGSRRHVGELDSRYHVCGALPQHTVGGFLSVWYKRAALNVNPVLPRSASEDATIPAYGCALKRVILSDTKNGEIVERPSGNSRSGIQC